MTLTSVQKCRTPFTMKRFFFLCRGSSARKSTWLIFYHTFCLSELSKALLLNGARGPMVERTTGCRYLPGATIQSEEVTDWVRTSTFKCFNLVMLQFYSYITYYFILNRLFLFDMYYCVFWHNKTKLKSSDHHALSQTCCLTGTQVAFLQRPVTSAQLQALLCRPHSHRQQPLQAVSCSQTPGRLPAGPLHGPLWCHGAAASHGFPLMSSFGQ